MEKGESSFTVLLRAKEGTDIPPEVFVCLRFKGKDASPEEGPGAFLEENRSESLEGQRQSLLH